MHRLYGLFYLEAEEVKQIIISVIAIAFAFSIAIAGADAVLKSPKEFAVFVTLSLVTVGSGFILHEMAHKVVAIYYGARAAFRMWMQGLAFMLIGSFFGVLFAAPGAVYIYATNITKKQNGLISIAGPAVNIGLAAFFLALALVKPVVFHLSFMPGPLNVWAFGAKINIMLALFNMLPAFPLDGSKVFAWSKLLWVASVILLLGLGSIAISPIIVLSWIVLLVLALVFSKLAFG